MLAFLIGTAGILRTSPVTPDGKRCPVYSQKGSAGKVQCRCAEKSKTAQDAAVTVVAVVWCPPAPLAFPWLPASDGKSNVTEERFETRARDVLVPPPLV